jgi:3-hydroxyisobutyrate dehydrogenase
VTISDDTGAEGGRATAGSDKIGFIGLGRMGFPMAGRIAAAGFRLTVFDLRPDVTAKFCDAYAATPVRRLADMAGVDLVLTMVPTSREVEQVLIGRPGSEGVAAHLACGALVVDCSSSDPLVTQRLGGQLAGRGIAMIDAPVAGGVVFAQDGSLDALVGGEAQHLARARPVLETFAKQILFCGGLGSGHAMKVLNNFVNAQALVTYVEAMTVGARFGISIDTMVEALKSATTDRNHPFEKKLVKQILSGEFATGMALRLISKDVSLARSLASGLGLWAPIMKQTAELWASAAEHIGGEVDQTEIVRLWESRSAIELRAGPSAGEAGLRQTDI